MRTSPFVALSVCVPILLIGQTPGPSCCQMKIDSDTGTAGILKIAIKNLNQPLVTLFETSPDVDFEVLLTSDTGADVIPTEYGRSLLTREKGGRRILRELKVSESFSENLDLFALFTLKSGAYTIVVSRYVTCRGTRFPLRTTAKIKVP